MSKGLEVLEIIKEKLCCSCEQECCACPYSSETITIEKELQELEIIKKAFLPCERPYGEQFDYVDFGNDYLCIDGTIWLSKEKIDLLKEVLL